MSRAGSGCCSPSGLIRLCDQVVSTGMPGSPYSGASSAVPALASSTPTDSAPCASSASLSSSATRASVRSMSDTQARGSPFLEFLLRELLLEIMDVGAALDKSLVEQQILVQRDIGLDALHRHLGQCDTHAAQRLLARLTVG